MLEHIRKSWQKQSKRHRDQPTASGSTPVEHSSDDVSASGLTIPAVNIQGITAGGTSEVVEAEVYRHIASFFPSSRNFEISGGQFNSYPNQQSTGNVIITVNQSGNDQLSGEKSQGGSAVTTEDEVHHTNLRSQPLAPRLDFAEFPSMPVQKSSEIYYRHLLIAGRGSPLWIPEPSNTLPIEYQRKGISIGDVGILTDSGSFDFLFNVYLPKGNPGHPINPEEMPEKFFPLNNPRSRDITSHMEYKNNSFVAGSFVKTRRDEEGPGLIFESSASEGAILAMPSGGNSKDLKNTRHIERYACANAEKWYKYATSDICGRKIKNGDLRLVLGYTSTTAWGMAVFVNRSEQNGLNFLKFKATGTTVDGLPQPTYGWEYSGKAEAKSGPDPQEIEVLRNLDRMAGEEGSSSYENQCLFVRTMNVTLQDEVWDKLSAEWGTLDLGNETHGFSQLNIDARSSGRSGGSFTGSSSSLGGDRLSSSGPSIPVDGLTPTHLKAEFLGPSVHLSDLPSVLTVHPSKVVNQFLLKEKPTAKMAITTDNDWIAVLEKNDVTFPDPETLTKRIKKTFDICDSEGVVSLQPRRYRYPTALPFVSFLQCMVALQNIFSRAIPDLSRLTVINRKRLHFRVREMTLFRSICAVLRAPSFSRFGWLGVFPLFNGPDFYLPYVDSLMYALRDDDIGWKDNFTFWMGLHFSDYAVYASLIMCLNTFALSVQTTDERSVPNKFISFSIYTSCLSIWLALILSKRPVLRMWFDLGGLTPELVPGACAIVYSLPYVLTLWSLMLFGVAAIQLLLNDFYYATPVAVVWITVHTLWIFSKATPMYVEENKVVRWVRSFMSRNKNRRAKTTMTMIGIRELMMEQTRTANYDVDFSVFSTPISSSGVGGEEDE